MCTSLEYDLDREVCVKVIAGDGRYSEEQLRLFWR